VRRTGLAGACFIGWLLAAGAVAAQVPDAPPAGPPYPPPIENVVVYDYADIFSTDTEQLATRTIVGIEERTAAEVVVYSQIEPFATTDSTERDAAALIDQWGVGRAGFDDGLAILFNMQRDTCHGQVQLFAGPGYRATFLSDGERQAIFDNDMLPLLRECDMDGALRVALARIDDNATADHARTLEFARIADAAIGLVGAPLIFLLLVGIAARSWLRYGRDPVYLDDPSILMPAPPPDLTAASGAVVWEGKSTRRALTTALLDLASRGELSFQPESGGWLGRPKMGIELSADPPDDPYVVRNRRRPLSAAETFALSKLRALGGRDGLISVDEMPRFATDVSGFTDRLEQHVAARGWFREPPAKAVTRWLVRGGVIIGAGVVAWLIANALPSGGLTLIAVSLGLAGVAILLVARLMPARTMAGAMVYAMLAAYRRTLHKTMEQARSMQEVVEQAQLEWLETPDQAVVWGVALGLHADIERVLERSADDMASGATTARPWLPVWYGVAGGGGSSGAQPGGLAPGLLSASAVPSFGGMMAALGSIGVAPGSSGGSGGFSGGGSGGGGGGGGAGGGF
jgi:uncharacterized membrane protein YgcG